MQRAYTVRIEGRVAGYQIDTQTPATENGRSVQLQIKSLVKIEVLGASVNQELQQTWILDPETRATLRVAYVMRAGPMLVAVDGALGDDGFSVEGGGALDAKVLDPARVVIARAGLRKAAGTRAEPPRGERGGRLLHAGARRRAPREGCPR